MCLENVTKTSLGPSSKHKKNTIVLPVTTLSKIARVVETLRSLKSLY